MRDLIYVSGPINGTTDYERRFSDATDQLLARGWRVVNPLLVPACSDRSCHDSPFEVLRTGHTWQCFVRHDLMAMLTCEHIFMLYGWPTSRGAMLEHHTADAIGMQIHYEGSGWPRHYVTCTLCDGGHSTGDHYRITNPGGEGVDM